MTKGGIIAGAALATVIGAGVGGYVFVENKVNTAIDTIIANASQSTFVDSITYDEKQLDLFAGSVSLNNFRVAYNLDDLDQLLDIESLKTSGTVQSRSERLTITGVWDLAFGGTQIARIEAINTSSDAQITHTMEDATVSTQIGDQKTEQRVDSATSTMVMTSQMPRLVMEGYNIEPFLGVDGGGIIEVEALKSVSVEAYDASDIVMDINMSMEASGPNAKPVPPMSIHYEIGRMHGESVSLSQIDLAAAKNIRITGKSPVSEVALAEFSIGEISISDTKLVDFYPVQATYTIKDMVVKAPNEVDPEMAMIMAMLGIEEFNFDMTLNFAWDNKDKSFTLAPFQFGLKKVGTVDLNLVLANLPSMDEMIAAGKTAQPRDPQELKDLSQEEIKAIYQQDMAGAEALFVDAALKHVALGYKDEGALKTFIAMQALQLGGDVNVLAQGVAQQAAALVTATHGAEKAKEVQDKLAAFINNPTELRIGLNAATPVKFTDLQKDIDANGPMALKAFQLDVDGGD